jgi:Kef-type K+ transport system membrane component KefB
VAFVTTVLIPSLRDVAEPARRLELFERLEGRFAFQARIATLVTGLSGFYLLHYLDAWGRYQSLQYWWVHLMTIVWLAFTLVLFVLEPLFLHRWFHERATADADKAFRVAQVMHVMLLSLSLLAVFGAVAGSHGWSFRWP